MLLQVGKAQEVCTSWGIRPRELEELIRVGAVRPARAGSGKGSLRLLDERSVCDLYFAHGFRRLGFAPRHAARVIRSLRREYRSWLTHQPDRILIRWTAEGEAEGLASLPRLVFDPRPLYTCLLVFRALAPDRAHVQRGRPRGEWRTMFRDAIARLSREMHEKRISETDINAAIEAERAERGRAVREAVVTVPAA